MGRIKQSVRPAGAPPSSQVEAAWKLVDENKHFAAIRLLKKHLKTGADDVLAENELAECLEYTGRFDQALDALDGWLSKRPEHPLLLRAKARAKSALGKHHQALALVDEAVEAWKRSPIGVAWSPPEELLAQLMAERWSVLYDLERYDEALELARSQISSDTARWHDKVGVTLVAVGRYSEAEAMYPPEWEIRAPSDIATRLVYLRRYQDAIPFLQRRLAYLTRPLTSDFSHLLAYMECLMYAGNVVELERLCAFWSRQRLSGTRRKCVAALRAAAQYSSGSKAAGAEQLKRLLEGLNQRREIRRMRDEFEFECTGELLLEILGKSLAV